MKKNIWMLFVIFLAGCFWESDFDKCINAKVRSKFYEGGGSLIDGEGVKKRKMENIKELYGGEFAGQCTKGI